MLCDVVRCDVVRRDVLRCDVNISNYVHIRSNDVMDVYDVA